MCLEESRSSCITIYLGHLVAELYPCWRPSPRPPPEDSLGDAVKASDGWKMGFLPKISVAQD